MAKLVILFQKKNKNLKNYFFVFFSVCEKNCQVVKIHWKIKTIAYTLLVTLEFMWGFGLRSFLELLDKLSHDKHAVSNFYHLASPRKPKSQYPKQPKFQFFCLKKPKFNVKY